MLSDCEAFCELYVEQCSPDEVCWAACAAEEEEYCPLELATFYSCLAAEPAPTFDCTQSYFAHSEMLCEDELMVFEFCRATRGEDCRFDPALDMLCAAISGAPPRFAICMVDVTPPAGCVRIGAGLCCP
jgi:hypothetical protein